jgi:negative regulator of sigma E activity
MQGGNKEIASMPTHHDIADLRTRAAIVTEPCLTRQEISARGAACALSGMIRLVAIQQGMEAMQRACANLARTGWARRATYHGDSATCILAAAAAGIELVAGRENTSAALAFWACESDPAVWRQVADRAA